MRLTFVAKDPPRPDGRRRCTAPTAALVVQGWTVTDAAALARMDIPEGESCVEIPDRLIPFFLRQHV
jgi:hypothetical protein